MMQLIRLHAHTPRPFKSGCVITWGSFDGVHLGHQRVLTELKAQAARLGLPAVVLITEPLAKEFFAADKVPPRLTGFRERLYLLADQQIDAVVCMRFNERLANTAAQDYVKQILLDQLAVKHIVLGDDSRFGYQRQGDSHLLKTMGAEHGFTVSDIETEERTAMRVSSTRVREALQSGEVALAESLLGHEYYIAGRVVHGEKRGRELGFPTANINIKRKKSPLLGVYAVELYNRQSQKRHQAVANIGLRPTFGGKFCLLEVHVLDFKGDLYGQQMQVFFKHKIRDEIRFADMQALQQQIARDVASAKAFFANSR